MFIDKEVELADFIGREASAEPRLPHPSHLEEWRHVACELEWQKNMPMDRVPEDLKTLIRRAWSRHPAYRDAFWKLRYALGAMLVGFPPTSQASEADKGTALSRRDPTRDYASRLGNVEPDLSKPILQEGFMELSRV